MAIGHYVGNHAHGFTQNSKALHLQAALSAITETVVSLCASFTLRFLKETVSG